MRLIPIRALLLCALVQTGADARSGAGPVFSTFGAAEGLPDSSVDAVVRDAHGYVWVGTRGGLVRHEGRRLSVLRHDPDDPSSLPGNNILSLFADSRGSVWAAISGQGLVELRGLEIRRHLPRSTHGGPLRGEYIWSMAEDCDGQIWLAFARSGLARLDPDRDTLEHFAPGPETGIPPEAFQLDLMVDSACRLWLVQAAQALVSEAPGQEPFRVVLDAARSGLGVALTVFEHSNGELFIGGREGLVRLGSTTEPEGWDEANRRRFDLQAAAVQVEAAEPGRLWLGGPDGLQRLHLETGELEVYRHSARLTDGLPGGLISALLRGPEGELWVGSSGGGLAMLPPGWAGFRRFESLGDAGSGLVLRQVSAIAVEPDGDRLWLGSPDDGLQWLDLGSGEGGASADGQPPGQPLLSTQGLMVTADGVLVATRNYLRLFDPASGESRELLNNNRFDGNLLGFVHPDGKEGYWLGVWGMGLYRISLDGEILERWHQDGDGVYALDEGDPEQMLRGPNGRWWLRGEHSVYVQQASGRFKPLDRSDPLRTLHMTWIGDEFWLASDSLLEVWRRSGEGLEPAARFAARDGLPAGQIRGIFPDDNGRLWLTLSTGLARFDPSAGAFRLFTRSEGLPAAEFLPRAGVQLADGRIAAGTTRGLVLIDPALITAPATPPPVWVTGMRAGQTRYSLAAGRPQAIELDHRQNSVELNFVALSYLDPGRNRFRFKLEGWDPEWLEQVGVGQQYYANLPPGRFRFRLQAANPEGVWNTDGSTLEFQIAPPPWRSLPALMAYGVLAITGAGLSWHGLLRTRRRRSELRRIREQQQLAAEQEAFLNRLNASLDPNELAEAIGRELLRLTGAATVWFGFLHTDFPDRLTRLGRPGESLDRHEWRRRLEGAAGPGLMAVTLSHEQQVLAGVVLKGADEASMASSRARLGLLTQTAGQALENARLLQHVRRLAVEAAQASAAKSEFLATMSHEIRTPLHGLLGMAELLERSGLDPDQREMLATINLSGRQLQRILNDVLDLSRIESGRIELDHAPFELTALLEQVVDLHAPTAARAGLELRLRVSSRLPVLAFGDAGRLAQVLGNLINNAVKFTTSGSVELDAWMDADQRLVFCVADTGPGIDAESRTRLFEPFTQLDPAATRQHGGTGLGLAICRRLVEAMGGRIDLSSRPRHGSRFSIRLPLPAGEPASPRTSRLLAGLRLAAGVSPGHYRVLMRLARRWGFKLLRLQPGQPTRPCEAVLVEAGHLAAETAIDVPAGAGQGLLLVLSSPSGRLTIEDFPPGARLLRWPLNETRLIAALMDFRFRNL